MFERIHRSWQMAVASWRVLYSDAKLILFPILSAVACTVVLVSFLAPLIGLHLNGTINLEFDENGYPPVWVYPVTFAFYFCNYFVIVFCNAALVHCALMHFNGQRPTLGDGFGAAFSRLPQIAAWAFVSATVGLILKVIESAHEKVGEIVSAVLGTAWTVVTFFVVPVLVVEKVGPFQAISRSLAILRKTWGEALVGGFGLGLFKFLLILPAILLLVAGGAMFALNQPQWLGFGLIGVGVASMVLACVAGAALDTIFLGALYQYANFEKVPLGFDREALEAAFATKKAA